MPPRFRSREGDEDEEFYRSALERHADGRACGARGAAEDLAAMTDCFVVVHLSSIDAYAFEGGDAADLIDQIVMTAQEAPCVIVIDQGWDGRYARRLRAELSGLKPLVFAHDEEIDGWRGFRKAFPKFLRGLGVRSVVLGGLWREGCVSEVRKILTAAGFLVSVDDDASGSEAVFCPEDAD